MDVLVAGATGLIGHAVATRLRARGDRVRALVRDPERAKTILPEGVEPVAGRRERPELGYEPAPIEEGIPRTVEALQSGQTER